MRAFKDVFMELLEESGMTRSQFARAAGLGTSYVSQICNGKVADPSFSKAIRIADTFGISLQSLWDLIEQNEH